jgi:adenine phosphoribosyltransferase
MDLRRLRELVRDVPDFPKPGIVFKDITPLLRDGPALASVIRGMAAQARALGATVVAGPESRGFLFGMGVALELGVGFVPIRKPRKLPYKTRSATYELEYGTDQIEVHVDAVGPGDRVVLVDDLLATGGTMSACCELMEALGAEVAGCLFCIELGFLKGRDRLPGRPVSSVIVYP